MNFSKLSKRFFAFYFDTIIVSSIVSVVLLLLKRFGTGISFENISKGDFSIFTKYFLLYFLVYLIYEIIFLSTNLSSTPGKIILEMEVVSYNSNFIKVFIRSVVKVIQSLPGLIFISGLVAAFSEKKQSIHDLLARTFVTDFDSRNRSALNKMDSTEFHEEMKKRGIKTYSEQQALIQELYGNPRKFTGKNLLKSPLPWILVLIISIIFNIIFTNSLISEMKSFLQF